MKCNGSGGTFKNLSTHQKLIYLSMSVAYVHNDYINTCFLINLKYGKYQLVQVYPTSIRYMHMPDDTINKFTDRGYSDPITQPHCMYSVNQRLRESRGTYIHHTPTKRREYMALPSEIHNHREHCVAHSIDRV